MASVTQRFLVCDGCGATTADWSLPYKSMQVIRICAANDQGWSSSGHMDYCKECSEKRRARSMVFMMKTYTHTPLAQLHGFTNMKLKRGRMS